MFLGFLPFLSAINRTYYRLSNGKQMRYDKIIKANLFPVTNL